MTFYIITTGDKYKERVDLLKNSCQKYNINFEKIDSEKFDFSKQIKLNRNDFLYRACPCRRSTEVWRYLITKETTTFYSSYEYSLKRPNYLIAFQKKKIPVPKTINYINDNRDLLKKYVEFLGGFPMVVKIMGGSCGVGVIKVDSYSSLFSIMDYLVKEEVRIVMKEFIEVSKPVFSCRAIILGDNVEIAYKNINVSIKDDFRSNVDQKKRKREILSLSNKHKKTLVKAVSILGTEMNSVDFVFDKKGDLKIFEVNFPFNFVPVVKDLKYKINDRMVEYLVKKQKLINK